MVNIFRPYCEARGIYIHSAIIGKCGFEQQDNSFILESALRCRLDLGNYRYLMPAKYEEQLIPGVKNIVFCTEKHGFTIGFKTVIVFSEGKGKNTSY